MKNEKKIKFIQQLWEKTQRNAIKINNNFTYTQTTNALKRSKKQKTEMVGKRKNRVVLKFRSCVLNLITTLRRLLQIFVSVFIYFTLNYEQFVYCLKIFSSFLFFFFFKICAFYKFSPHTWNSFCCYPTVVSMLHLKLVLK